MTAAKERPPTATASLGVAAEIRRALHARNLGVAAAAALVLAVPVYLGIERYSPGFGRSATIAALFAFATFGAITLLHVALHGYFAWRFARGLRAFGRGRWRTARRLLAARAWPGMAHYDTSGSALRVWQALRERERTARIPSGDRP